ncbi:MAG: HAMP domain-containing histidine kinase [Cytophagaceae bacterium]|jgi:hypothetical protein|nr:HAMP domain-containing histidine kinase [Cytophagaceae bacterium]
MKLYHHFFYRVLLGLRHHPLGENQWREEMSRAIFCAQLILATAGIVLPFIFVNAIFHPLFNVLIDLAILVVLAIGFSLILKGRFTFAKYFLIFLINLCVFINGSTYGENAGFQFLWYVIICAVFLLFSIKQYFHLLSSLAICLGFITAAELSHYSLFLLENTSAYSDKIMYITCMATGILMISFYFFYFLRLYYKSEAKLRWFIKTLKNKNLSLNKINGELDSFVYRASHDLRAPLSSLMALVTLAKSESNMGHLKEYIFHQEKSIQKLDSYIVDILNLSKNARKDIELSEIRLTELLDEILTQYAFLKGYDRIVKQFEFDASFVLITDKKRLVVVLNNLISNSLRYHDLNKREPYIRIKATVNSSEYEISVRDNGIGIEKKHLPNIFQMFYRASNHSEGSGLGLYLVQETVLKLGGTISVDSEQHEWTEFTIRLPIQAGFVQQNQAPHIDA